SALTFSGGQHEDFDEWAAKGAAGWSYREVLPHFKRLETFEGPDGRLREDTEYHGDEGEMGVSTLRNDHPYCRAWLDAAQELGLPANPDFNAETTFGVGSYQLSIRDGW